MSSASSHSPLPAASRCGAICSARQVCLGWRSRSAAARRPARGGPARTGAPSPAAGSARWRRARRRSQRLVDQRGQQVEHRPADRGRPRRRPPRRHRASIRRRTPRAAEAALLLLARAGRGSSRPRRASVCWRGIAERAPPVNRRKRSPSPAAICSTPSTRTRAAASSIASGMPSRSWQICATPARSRRRRAKFGRTFSARSMNSRTASD